MRQLNEAPDTLIKIFPEAKTLEEKAVLLIELKETCGSFREMSRALGHQEDTDSLIHHQTISRLYAFLKDTEVYQEWQWEKNEQIKDFLSKDFYSTIHSEYKEQRERIEKVIARALKEKDKDGKAKPNLTVALLWIQEKRRLLKDMVTTAMNLQPQRPDPSILPAENPMHSETKYKQDTEFTEAVENWKEGHKDVQ